jgi:sirohydrochlorin ferrochelatase
MTTESIQLIGRATCNAHGVFETPASRLSDRAAVDDVEIATDGGDPIRELGGTFERTAAGSVYAVPVSAAHSHEAVDDIPAALSYLPGNVQYREPLARSPAITEPIDAEATSPVPEAVASFSSSLDSGVARNRTTARRSGLTQYDSTNSRGVVQC